MFLLIILLICASSYVSNAKMDDNIKVGINVVIIIIALIIILTDIF